jgi:hypothetical protein
MKFISHISGIIAVVSFVLAVIARLFLVNKALFGLSSLSYLRVTNTMLLFTIAFLVFEYVRRK